MRYATTAYGASSCSVKFATISESICGDPSAFEEKGLFNQGSFWASTHQHALPIHYALWVAEVGCCKVASANIETVFSGAGRISKKSRKLSPTLLSDCAFCHYNYKYDWLRTNEAEIIAAYVKLYSKGKPKLVEESDASSSDSSAEESAEEEEDDGEDGEGGEGGAE